jgi:poly-gamma-glutamate synthesis protein (capsule biosynthesis protein)
VASWLSRALPLLGLLSACAACDSFDFTRVFGSAVAPHASSSASAAPTASAPPPKEKADSIVVFVGGDVWFGGNASSYLAADKNYDPLAGLRPVLEDTDLRIASLASPITVKAAAPGPNVAPVGARRAADALARAGVNAVAVANPFLFTSGQAPFDDTLANLLRVSVTPAGAGSAPMLTELEIKGFRVALFAVATFTDKDPGGRAAVSHVAPADPSALSAAIRGTRANHDLVLVSHHAGRDLSDSPTPEQISLARAAIAAGADAVFNHGSRVPSGVGWISGKPVFYGLGNLIAEEDRRNPWTARGLAARIAFSNSHGATVDACPLLIQDGEPKLLAGAGRAGQEGVFRRTLSRSSEEVGGTEIGEPDLHSCMRLAPHGTDGGTR